MTLTHRQSAVVAALLDLYAESRRPISYRVVAERLRVAPATAYRMLRLAGSKGYVEAVYERPDRAPAAGRSAVLFTPTELARRRIAELAGSAPDADWEAAKARILAAVSLPAGLPDGATLQALLAGLEPPTSPLDRAGRTIADLMICLEQAGAPADELLAGLVEQGTRFGIATLGGLLLGLALADRVADRTGRFVAYRLDRQVDSFASAVAALSPAQATDLTRFAAQLGRFLRGRRLGGPAANVDPSS